MGGGGETTKGVPPPGVVAPGRDKAHPRVGGAETDPSIPASAPAASVPDAEGAGNAKTGAEARGTEEQREERWGAYTAMGAAKSADSAKFGPQLARKSAQIAVSTRNRASVDGSTPEASITDTTAFTKRTKRSRSGSIPPPQTEQRR